MKTLLFLLFSPVLFGLDYGEKQNFEIPQRHHSIIASKEGFYPNKISMFEGEKLIIYLTTTSEGPSCFYLKEKNLFLTAHSGKISEGEAFFEKPGVYRFYCPSTKIDGKITVLKRPSLELKREVASKKIRYWYPKDK